MTERKNVYQRVNERLIEMIETTGQLPWEKTWNDRTRPMNLSSGNPYHGSNLFFLRMAQEFNGYRTGYWLTFLQTRDMGGKVRRGEKGELIVYFDYQTETVEQFKPDSETEEREEVEWTRPILRYYTVFNLDQIEGIEAPVDTHDNEPLPTPERLIENYSEMVAIEPGAPAYNPQKDIISMPEMTDFKSSESYYSTLFHEVTHSTGHEERLNRKLKGQANMNDYRYEELIAELGASYLCSMTGIENQKALRNHAAYLQGWLEALNNNNRLFISASGKAEQAVKYIIKHAQVEAETVES